ncbi:MAG: glycoside hydrolase family 2 [Prevotella sp.]|nr:glycoside hydrolase family 2 [Prevotella sp.]
MKKNLLACLLMGSMAVSAQNTLNISGNDWQFFYAKDARVADSLEATGFYRMDYDSRSFRQTPVPSNWAILGYEEPVYRGFKNDEASEGFYIRKFTIPASFEGKRVVLHFGGVWNSAEVWLNGQRLGRHDSGYTSFSFNVTGAFKADTVNTLAVRVRQVYPGYKTDTYDDWTLGGIYRDVVLESMPRTQWIEQMTAVTHFDHAYRNADLEVRATIANTQKNTLPGNYPSPGKDYTVRVRLTDRDGKVVGEKNILRKGHVSTSKEVKTVLQLTAPHQWTAETPYLYTLSVAILGDDGLPTHQRTEKIGIREVSTRGGVLRINGQAVKMRGVNRHDEHPDVGRAVGPKHWLEDLEKMKGANVNYIRACHYQHAKPFIEMCDSIGMYVGAEVSLGGAGTMMYDPSYIAPVMLRCQETVERDLNNPSIIYWSVGNEDPYTYMHLRAIRTVKAIDPTRPVLMPWNASEELPEEIDILAPHYWTSYEYDSLCAQSKRPIVTTEYVHAYGLQRFGGLEDCFKALHKHPAGAGGAVWMWADQGVKTPTKKDPVKYKSLAKDDDYLRLDAAGWDGVTDSYRQPTRDFWEVKAVYAPVYPDVQCIALPKGAKTVAIPIRNDYDFLSVRDVNIDYRLFIDEREISNGKTSVDAAPHATADMTVDVSKVGKLQEGQTCYVQLVFFRPDGSEIGRKYVELKPEQMTPANVKRQSLAVTENGGSITVTVGKSVFDFSRQTGLLSTLTRGGKKAVEGLRPSIWHALNDGDQIIKNRKFPQGTDPEKFTADVKSMTVSEEQGRVVIRSSVAYTIDAQNHLTADYVSTVDETGALTIDYAIRPEVQMNYLPIVSMAVKMTSADDLRQWLGLGPDDAYPNKKAGCILGVWDAKQLTGTRQARWLDFQSTAGVKTRILADGYIDRDKTTSQEVRIASQILGRSEKGRLNDRNYQVLPNKEYKGTLTITE